MTQKVTQKLTQRLTQMGVRCRQPIVPVARSQTLEGGAGVVGTPLGEEMAPSREREGGEEMRKLEVRVGSAPVVVWQEVREGEKVEVEEGQEEAEGKEAAEEVAVVAESGAEAEEQARAPELQTRATMMI